MTEEVGPRAYRKRTVHAVRRCSGDDSIITAGIRLALLWAAAGAVFTAYMWALDLVGRLYWQ